LRGVFRSYVDVHVAFLGWGVEKLNWVKRTYVEGVYFVAKLMRWGVAICKYEYIDEVWRSY
jgi:hypothetical protein